MIRFVLFAAAMAALVLSAGAAFAGNPARYGYRGGYYRAPARVVAPAYGYGYAPPVVYSSGFAPRVYPYGYAGPGVYPSRFATGYGAYPGYYPPPVYGYGYGPRVQIILGY